MPDLKIVRGEIEKMVGELCSTVAIQPRNVTELEREGIGAFAFGMVAMHCAQNGLSLEQMNSLADIMLMDVLLYTPESAIAFSHNLMMSLNDMVGSDNHSGLNAIICYGCDAYKQWQDGDVEELRKNLQGVLDWLASSVEQK